MNIWVFLCLFLIACQAPETKPTFEVIEKVESHLSGPYRDLEVTYTAKQDTCEISWIAIRDVDKSKPRHVALQFRNLNPDCKKNFVQLKSLHQAILTKLFKTFPSSLIKGLHTGGLKTINPSGDWNETIIRASLLLPEWNDYRINYPNHKSKLSSNDLLVMLMKQEAPHAEFKQLFLTFDLNIEIEGVEKVFNHKVGKVTAIQDAGSLWWKPL